MRHPISKSLRFSVFERDEYTCQYCGRRPPEAVLHLDHVHPVARGGDNKIDNLLTACRDCNIGKGARDPGLAMPSRPRTPGERHWRALSEQVSWVAFFPTGAEVKAVLMALVDGADELGGFEVVPQNVAAVAGMPLADVNRILRGLIIIGAISKGEEIPEEGIWYGSLRTVRGEPFGDRNAWGLGSIQSVKWAPDVAEIYG